MEKPEFPTRVLGSFWDPLNNITFTVVDSGDPNRPHYHVPGDGCDQDTLPPLSKPADAPPDWLGNLP